jgi:transposase-like protein
VLWEQSKMEQRYDAVLGVIRDGFTVTEVARKFGVTRQTIHAWMARYEAHGIEGLDEPSRRPKRSQKPPPRRHLMTRPSPPKAVGGTLNSHDRRRVAGT